MGCSKRRCWQEWRNTRWQLITSTSWYQRDVLSLSATFLRLVKLYCIDLVSVCLSFLPKIVKIRWRIFRLQLKTSGILYYRTQCLCICLSVFLSVKAFCTIVYLHVYMCVSVSVFLMPLVLWRCWLGGRKGTRPVNNWVVGCWRGYLSGARCRLA